MRGAVLVLLGLATAASGHPVGTHKRVLITVSQGGVEGLVTLDLDGSEQTALTRQGSDRDGNGVLEGAELTALRERLVQLAVRPLKLALSGYALKVVVKDSKLNVREDRSVGRTGLSVAVLFESQHPHAVSRGTRLQISDAAPDLSPVALELFQRTAPDAGAEAPVAVALTAGTPVEVTLGSLQP